MKPKMLDFSKMTVKDIEIYVEQESRRRLDLEIK